jgi:regulator of nucleoside diphosphate kinase
MTNPASSDILVSELDEQALRELIAHARFQRPQDEALCRSLEELLDLARVVPPHEVPSDVVVLNSKVRLKDLDSGRETVFTLVLPRSADIQKSRISILAPVGMVVFGRKVRDPICVQTPAGVRHAEIVEILGQPEGAGQDQLG